MQKTLFASALALLLSPCCGHAEMTHDIWYTYVPPSKEMRSVWQKYLAYAACTRGRMIGDMNEIQRAYFYEHWKYRSVTYELYFAKATELAASVYALALFVGDVDASLAKETFLHNVLGFHYSQEQVCAWAKSLWHKDADITHYPYLLQVFVQDGVLCLSPEGFRPSATCRHILGAAQGSTRSFVATLRHERLHIFWDEDANFRQERTRQWHALSERQKNDIRKELHRYAQDNEAQIIEEWSVHMTETPKVSQ